jgi:hypothetical protein
MAEFGIVSLCDDDRLLSLSARPESLPHDLLSPRKGGVDLASGLQLFHPFIVRPRLQVTSRQPPCREG